MTFDKMDQSIGLHKYDVYKASIMMFSYIRVS
jgi:hypothetical protein